MRTYMHSPTGIRSFRQATFPLVAIVCVVTATALLAIGPRSADSATAFPVKTSIMEFDTAMASHQDQEQSAIASYENLPLTFIENRGQVHPRVHYYGQRGNFGVYFTQDEIMFFLQRRSPIAAEAGSGSRRNGGRLLPHIVPATSTDVAEAHATALLALKFLHPSPHSTLTAQGREPGTVNYFHG